MHFEHLVLSHPKKILTPNTKYDIRWYIVQPISKHIPTPSLVSLMRGSRHFRQGVGGSRSVWQKGSNNVFFSPQLILQKSNGQFQRNLSFFKVPEGSNIYQGGPTFFRRGGGSNCLFPIETHITCDFPGGSGLAAPPPLWIRTCLFPTSALFLLVGSFFHLNHTWRVSPVIILSYYL